MRPCNLCQTEHRASPRGEREREFILHIATTLEQAHNRNTKLGRTLPESTWSIKTGHPLQQFTVNIQ